MIDVLEHQHKNDYFHLMVVDMVLFEFFYLEQ
jgi:hypothetical protein